MAAQPPKLLLCDCGQSFEPDARAIEKGTGLACPNVATELCGREAAKALAALKDGPTVVACGQETERFTEIAGEAGDADLLTLVDIRDRAGWSADASGPKMAALVADALLPTPAVRVMDVLSEGVCLVYGPPEQALTAGARLAEVLSVTVMVTDGAAIDTAPAGIDIVRGRVAGASGALGGFALRIDGFAELGRAGRGGRRFGPARDGAESQCDLILDLSGGTPLFPAHEKRDGYLRPDPGDPLAVERALFDAVQLVGEFEKSLHIRFDASLCAHSRAEQTACTRCLDVCPTGAIRPDGETVAIDPHICAGCGACSAVCPSGAASTEEPPVAHLFRRMRTMAEAYRAAGGTAPRLLVHDDHGADMIPLLARHGAGLPGDVVPMEIPALASFGHAEALVARALGFADVRVLAGPKADRAVLEAQAALADAIAGGVGHGAGWLAVIDPADPDALPEALGPAPQAPETEPILPLGARREAVRLAARALGGEALPESPIPLPAGAPYGAVVVDDAACTLCLSCAGLCPPGALGDNPDRPELTFKEDACLQCGLCVSVCPENAIQLVPQLDLSDAALAPRVMKAEEPFACIECGALFGVKSTVERIIEKLAGTHPMFIDSDNARLIQMCDDCRVRAQYHAQSAPFAAGERPRVRTTDDYLTDRDKPN